MRDVHQALDEADAHVPWQEAEQLVGVAGTITTVAALALGLDRYRPDVVHGSRIGLDRLAEVADRLLALDHAGRAALGAIHPGRVDVIAAGALVLRTVVERCGMGELVVSEHDILDGIAQSIS